jgi:flavin reductase (DIM6/NTAB) family NADH-FMN oxidoreductase RutF
MREPVSVSRFHRLLHPYNTFLVTCCDEDGQPNIITIAWLIPLSIKPPLLGMAVRQTRYSYGLIRATGEFVVNVAPYEIAQAALFCGRRSGRDVDKFAATGLTADKAQRVHPPVIQECVAHLECRLVDEVKTGDHQLLVAEVLATYTRPGVLSDSGLYNLQRVHPLLHLGGNRFTSPQQHSVEPSLPEG